MQDSLDYYNELLEYYIKAIVNDWHFDDFADPCWDNRDELEESSFKDDNILRKLDTLLFYLMTKEEAPSLSKEYYLEQWYSHGMYIYKKEYPIEYLPEYLKPLYQQYLNGEEIILPDDVLELYENYKKGEPLKL